MAHQVPWNKIILEEFIRLAILSKDEETVMRTRVAGWTRVEQSMKLGMSLAMVRYYIERYNRLIPGTHASDPAILPGSWMGRTRLEVEIGIKRMAVKDLFKRWVDWESSTVSSLQAHAQSLYSTGDIVCADYIGRMAQDVADELKTATGMMIDLEAVDYDMTAILDRQPALHRKYKHKLQEIGEAFS